MQYHGTSNFITEYLGRISFPLFAFLLVEGYLHTKNLKKYYKRLIIFAIISQIPFMLFRTLVGEWKMLNIMFTLLCGLLCITAYDKIKKEYIQRLISIKKLSFLYTYNKYASDLHKRNFVKIISSCCIS